MKKEYALIYDSTYEAMQYCTMEERGILFSALIEYQKNGTIPDINGLLMAMFMQAKALLDRGDRRYNQCVENGKKGAEYGKLGGRPRKAEQHDENEKPLNNPKENPKENPQITPYKNNNNNNITSLDREVCKNSDDFLPETPPPQPKVDYERIVDLYHTICTEYPRIVRLSEPRKQKIRIRLVDEMNGDYSVLKQVFEKMQASKFMRGDNRQGWKATFDWVFEDGKNWVKVLEGNYDNIKKTENQKTYVQW